MISRIKMPRVPNEGQCDLSVQYHLEPVHRGWKIHKFNFMSWNQNTGNPRYECPTQPNSNQNIWGTCKAALHSTYRIRRILTLPKQMQIGTWFHPGST